MRTTNEIEDLSRLAEAHGLKYIETTTARNGYPEKIRGAIIGFESFEEAEELAKEWGLRIAYFTRKDGWQLWTRSKGIANRAFELTGEHFGNNCSHYTKYDEEFFYEREIEPFLGEFNHIRNLKDFIEQREAVSDAINELEQGELLIVRDGYPLYVVQEKAMSYYSDTWTYTIGVDDEEC